jgi:hypothetical protein
MGKAKLAKVSVEDLKKEIGRRQRKLPTLIAVRDALNCQIAELEGLGAVKPVAVARRRKAGRKKAARRAIRPARAGSLSSALTEALASNGKLSVAQATAAVQMAGYKSKSKNFQTIVGMTLSQGTQFRRVGRGVYTLRD